MSSAYTVCAKQPNLFKSEWEPHRNKKQRSRKKNGYAGGLFLYFFGASTNLKNHYKLIVHVRHSASTLREDK